MITRSSVSECRKNLSCLSCRVDVFSRSNSPGQSSAGASETGRGLTFFRQRVISQIRAERGVHRVVQSGLVESPHDRPLFIKRFCVILAGYLGFDLRNVRPSEPGLRPAADQLRRIFTLKLATVYGDGEPTRFSSC